MINLLEEEYDAASGKYILHLTMGTEDTLSDLPSAEKPFNSSNHSCFFDYGEPAEPSTKPRRILSIFCADAEKLSISATIKIKYLILF